MLIPNIIVPDLRTNHAGETGAVFIYKGILLFSKDREIIEFLGEKTDQYIHN